MSEGPRRYPPSTMRASDADRDVVLTELGEHFQAGRLTSDELDERTGKALQARTFGELAPLMADLPPLTAGRPPADGADHAAGLVPATAGPARSPGLMPVVLGLVAVAVVVGTLRIGTGAGGSQLWWLILVVPLVMRRMARGRR
jgi:hypothetical protein